MKKFTLTALLAALLFVGLESQSARAQVTGGIGSAPGQGTVEPIPGGDFPGDHHGISEIDRKKAKQLTKMLYQGILFRNGDKAGIQHYTSHIEMNGVQGLIDSAFNMANSEEFYRNIQSRYKARQIVQNIYRVFFSRPADTEGLEHWSNLIRQGQAAEALAGIVSSEEFLTRNVFTEPSSGL